MSKQKHHIFLSYFMTQIVFWSRSSALDLLQGSNELPVTNWDFIKKNDSLNGSLSNGKK